MDCFDNILYDDDLMDVYIQMKMNVDHQYYVLLYEKEIQEDLDNGDKS